MKTLSVVCGVTMILGCAAAASAGSKPYISETFQDILARVSRRSQGAIVEVIAKKDSPRAGPPLVFSIQRDARHEGEVILYLDWPNKIDDGVYERYRLKIDDALQEELALHEKLTAASGRFGKSLSCSRSGEFRS